MAELNLLRKTPNDTFVVRGEKVQMPNNQEFWQEALKEAENRGISKELIGKSSSLITNAYMESRGLTMQDFGKMVNPQLNRAKVSELLTNTNTKPLFEALTETFLRGAFEKAGRAEQLTMGPVTIDQQQAEYYYTEGYEDNKYDFMTVAQGGPIPVMTIKLEDKKVIRVYKRGGGIELTDEAKSMNFDMLSKFFERQGMVLGRTDEQMVVDRLQNGYFDDGFDKPQTLGVKSEGKIDPMDLWFAQNYMVEETGFTPNVAVMNLKTAEEWTSMETGQGAPIFLQNQLDGTTPNLLKSQPFVTNQMDDGKIMLVDTQFAINEYVYKPLSTENERNVRTQIDGSYTTKTSDFVPFERNARLIVDINESRGKK